MLARYAPAAGPNGSARARAGIYVLRPRRQFEPFHHSAASERARFWRITPARCIETVNVWAHPNHTANSSLCHNAMASPLQTRLEAGGSGAPNPFGGRIYTPKELAELWQLSENSVRRLFQDEPGVFVLGDSNPRGKRGYCTLRITEETALRVWRARVTR